MTGDDLKTMRARYGLTQAQAASMAMVTTRQYQNWEWGKRDMPEHRVKLLKHALLRIRKREK